MKYFASINWNRKPGELFTDLKYSRTHTWVFDGGVEIPASSSPHVVPLPFSDESAVDPEEVFIASISSCHMLFFLSIAAGKNFTIDSYVDEAEGVMDKNEAGRLAITKIYLKPRITFSGSNLPDEAQIADMHHKAHEKCFIANSVKSEINIL